MDFVELIGLIIAIIGLPSAIVFVYKLIRKPFKHDLNHKNLSYTKLFDNKNKRLDNRLCLFIYVLDITNMSNQVNTIKSINLSYRYNKKNYTGELYSIQTGTLPDQNKPAVVFNNGSNNVICMNWENIGQKISERKGLNPGEVLSGSALFLMSENIKDPRKITDLVLIIKSYSGKETKHKIKSGEYLCKGLEQNFKIVNRKWQQLSDKTIELL